MALPIDELNDESAGVPPASEATAPPAGRIGRRARRRRTAVATGVFAGALAVLAATAWPDDSAAGRATPEGRPPGAGGAAEPSDCRAGADRAGEGLPGRGPGFVVTDEGIVDDARLHPAAPAPAACP